jgi:pimeloyl-ACP methyl ester carboxylesterase
MELRALLDRSGEKPPYVLVGHSFGGLVMRIFAKRYPDVSAGLVLVDPAQPEDWLNPGGRELERLRRGALLCRFAARRIARGHARVVSALVGRGALTPAWSIRALVSRAGSCGQTTSGCSGQCSSCLSRRAAPLRSFWTQRGSSKRSAARSKPCAPVPLKHWKPQLAVTATCRS